MQNLIIFILLLVLMLKEMDTLLPCPILKLPNGKTRYRQKGRFVKFVCNVGYLIAGDKYSTCQGGIWDNALPKCVRATCIKVKPPSNGLIYQSHRGGVLNFFCEPGYDLHGSNATYCDGHKWDNQLPSCILTNSTPSLNCDFENEDICGWNHDLRHDFEWTRMSNKTPSGHFGTGPSFDHTKTKNGSGFYMYIEASSRNENDTARLISPIFPKIKDACLQFYYHMYGATTGRLKVYIKKISQNWTLGEDKQVFSKSGNQGNIWLEGWVELNDIEEEFQIIIEGIRGSSYFSDIAIDDIQMIPNCTSISFTTENNHPFYITEIAPEEYQSCLNRCGFTSKLSELNILLQCDCDDECLTTKSCCPDYIAECIIDINYTNDYTQEFTTIIDILKQTTSTSTFSQNSLKTTSTREVNTENTIEQATSTEIITPSSTMDEYFINISTKQKITSEQMKTITASFITTSEYKRTTELNLYTEGIKTYPTVKAKITDTVKEKKGISNKLIIILAACVSTTILAILILIAIQKYKYCSCRNFNYKNNSSDSQSDVRFLTSDEILNFNLATPNEC